MLKMCIRDSCNTQYNILFTNTLHLLEVKKLKGYRLLFNCLAVMGLALGVHWAGTVIKLLRECCMRVVLCAGAV